LDDPDFLLRFQNEAASAGRIHHPNVVTIYESGQAHDGTPYIAMERGAFPSGGGMSYAPTHRTANIKGGDCRPAMDERLEDKMNRVGLVFLFLVLASRVAFAADQADKPSFPNDSQINLLLTQSESAFETFELTIKQEQLELGKEGAEGAARDRQLLDRVHQYLPQLKANPQAFNSPVGFLLVIDLEHASHKMALCMGQAGMDASLLAFAGNNISAGQSKQVLAQACMGASELLSIVAETAVSMYERYLLANHDLQQREEGAIGKCMEILKKQGPPK
jgi:hypothetical protein